MKKQKMMLGLFLICSCLALAEGEIRAYDRNGRDNNRQCAWIRELHSK